MPARPPASDEDAQPLLLLLLATLQ